MGSKFHFLVTLYLKWPWTSNFTVMYFSSPVMKGDQQVFSKIIFRFCCLNWIELTPDRFFVYFENK